MTRRKLSASAARTRELLLADDPATFSLFGEYELAGSLASRMEEIVYNHGYATSMMLSQGDVERARAVRDRLEKEFWELAKHEGLVELLEAAWADGLRDGPRR